MVGQAGPRALDRSQGVHKWCSVMPFKQVFWQSGEDQLLISKCLVGILPRHAGQSFVFLEVAIFLATKCSTFQWSNGVLNS